MIKIETIKILSAPQTEQVATWLVLTHSSKSSDLGRSLSFQSAMADARQASVPVSSIHDHPWPQWGGEFMAQPRSDLLGQGTVGSLCQGQGVSETK